MASRVLPSPCVLPMTRHARSVVLASMECCGSSAADAPPVKGSFRYGPGAYPLAISLVERGLVDLKPLVTQRYAFNDAIEAFETTKNGKDSHGKVGHLLGGR